MTAIVTRHPLITGMLALAALAALVITTIDLPGLWNQAIAYGIDMQRDLHRDLAGAMRAVQRSGGAAFWSLVVLGFTYGVFHAVGPGHGKVVISTYLATHESRLVRGIALSLLSSLVQGLTAILLVGGVALVMQRSMRESQSLGVWLEVLSYGLVILIGLFLAWRGARRLIRGWRQATAAAAACCHGHGPTASDLEAPLSGGQLVAMILSIGIRPCSGAILVLVLAFALEQLWAGIAAVAAMSVGTGLSISGLAALSVFARKGAIRLASTFEQRGSTLARLFDIAALLGGLVITGFGFALLNASLAVSRHPLL